MRALCGWPAGYDPADRNWRAKVQGGGGMPFMQQEVQEYLESRAMRNSDAEWEHFGAPCIKIKLM